MSRKTRTRVRGLRELGTTAARRNPVVDSALTTKEVLESSYRVVKGKEPPSARRYLSIGEMWDKREARRERAFDRQFGK